MKIWKPEPRRPAGRLAEYVGVLRAAPPPIRCVVCDDHGCEFCPGGRSS